MQSSTDIIQWVINSQENDKTEDDIMSKTGQTRENSNNNNDQHKSDFITNESKK